MWSKKVITLEENENGDGGEEFTYELRVRVDDILSGIQIKFLCHTVHSCILYGMYYTEGVCW